MYVAFKLLPRCLIFTTRAVCNRRSLLRASRLKWLLVDPLFLCFPLFSPSLQQCASAHSTCNIEKQARTRSATVSKTPTLVTETFFVAPSRAVSALYLSGGSTQLTRESQQTTTEDDNRDQCAANAKPTAERLATDSFCVSYLE